MNLLLNGNTTKTGLCKVNATRPLYSGVMYFELPFTTQEQILDDIIEYHRR